MTGPFGWRQVTPSSGRCRRTQGGPVRTRGRTAAARVRAVHEELRAGIPRVPRSRRGGVRPRIRGAPDRDRAHPPPL